MHEIGDLFPLLTLGGPHHEQCTSCLPTDPQNSGNSEVECECRRVHLYGLALSRSQAVPEREVINRVLPLFIEVGTDISAEL